MFRNNTVFSLIFSYGKMDSNSTKTSYFCEDQIDELNNRYLEFCSQYEQATEFVLSQTQSEGSKHENSGTGDDLTNQSQQWDFQAAFEKFVGSYPDEHFDDSDTDLNMTISEQARAVIVQNPHLADAKYKPSIETYLECSQYFETIKATPPNVPKKANGPPGEVRFKIGPQVLMIADILKINIDPMNSGPLSSERMLYGQKFRSVLFYGRCHPDGIKYTKNYANDSQSEYIKKKYIVDDGFAKIVIHTSQSTNSDCQRLKSDVNILRYQLDGANRDGLPFLGHDHYKSNTPKCNEILKCCNSIMRVIDRNMAQNKNELRNGAKVCVEGAPFRNSRTNNIEIFAYRIYEDSGPNRQMELSFMDHLMKEYETKLFKFKITGERI